MSFRSPLGPACWLLALCFLFLIPLTSSAQIASSVTTIPFGNVQVGSSLSMTFPVTDGGKHTLTLEKVTVSGTGFSFTGPTLPIVLNPTDSVTLTLAFDPQAAASFTGSVRVVARSDIDDVYHYTAVTATLSGTGYTAGSLTAPSPISFGSVTIGDTASQTGSLTASGGNVIVSSASSTNAQFSLSGLTLPLSIPSGQSVPFTVTFAPTASGSASATLSFFTSTSTSAQASASGTGATIQHTVGLSWDASTSNSVSGYNVLRGTTHGGPYSQVNSSVNASLNYSDNSVQSGQTYYYVTTAVEANGDQSAYSNEVQAAVPFP